MINTKDLRDIQALAIIWQKGGEISMNAVARAMGVNSDYARLILFDIGKKDYIDITKEGICKITEKGKEMLRGRGIKQATEEKPKIITLKY